MRPRGFTRSLAAASLTAILIACGLNAPGGETPGAPLDDAGSADVTSGAEGGPDARDSFDASKDAFAKDAFTKDANPASDASADTGCLVDNAACSASSECCSGGCDLGGSCSSTCGHLNDYCGPSVQCCTGLSCTGGPKSCQ